MNDNPTGTPVPPANTPSDPLSTASTNYSRWMTNIWEEIKSLRLSQLAIPGTHNSGVDLAGTWGLEEMYGANQDKSFPEQLAAGARYFDLRLVDSSYVKVIGNHSPQYKFIEVFEFKHGVVSAGRRLEHLIRDVKNFVIQNPQEIVILDFHTYDRGRNYSNSSLERCLPYFTSIERFLIPRSFSNKPLYEIRNAYPSGSIILAMDHNYPVPQGNNAPPDKWQPGWVQRSQIWGRFKHEWNSTELSEKGILELVTQAMLSPPSNGLWVLSASAYGATGPIHLNRNNPIRTETFKEGYQNVNIVMVDFIERSDTIYSVVDRCIVLNKLRHLDRTPPSAPTNLLVKVINVPDPNGYTLQNTLEFTWERASDNLGVHQYEVYSDNKLEFRTHKTTHRQKNLHLRNYTFKVRASDIMENSSSLSEPFQLIQDTTPPTIPENFLLAPPIGYKKIRVQWDESFDSAGIEGYELRRNGQRIAFTSQTSYTISDLDINEEHILELRAKDVSGLFSEYTKVVLPPRPKLINPRVTIKEFNESNIYKARLTWDFSTPPQSPVYCGYKFGDSYITSTHIEGELPGVDFDARKDEQFEFTCRIGFLGVVVGEPDLSEEFTYALTFDPTPPTPVSDLKVTLRTESNISISWIRPPSQKVEYLAISLDEAPPTLLPASANNYNFLVVENKEHLIEVWTISDIGIPSTTTQLAVRMFDNIPEKPGIPVVSDITHSSAKLSWAASSGLEVKYKVSLNGFIVAYTNDTFFNLTHLRDYFNFRVEIRAFNSAGSSQPAITTFKTLLTPPVNLRFSHLNGLCRLAWNPTFGNSPSHEISINGRVFTTGPRRWGYSFKLQDVSPGPAPHHFTFKVRAQLDGANSEVSLLEKSLVDDAPPSQPGAPTISNISDSSATITWSPASDNVGVTEYLVVLNGFLVFTTPDPRYTLYSLTSGAHYYVYIRAKDKDGNLSAPSKIAVFKTTGQSPSPPPSAPRVNVTAETATSLTLNWGSLEGASGVRILRNDEHWRDVFLLSSVTMLNLVPSVEYTISVSTFDLWGQLSEPTVITHELKDTTPPSSPGNLRKSASGSDSVTLAWNASTDDIGICDYVIYNNHEYFDRTPLTHYSAIGLMPGTHRFEVLAQDLSGNLSAPTSLDVHIEGDESI